MEKFINTLSQGATLQGKSYSYCLEKVLGQGGFGITYLSSVKMQGALGSIDAKVKVAVKEFFMKEINGREGTTVTSGSKGGLFADYRKKFIREATNLSKLQHPSIIKVLECFEANNTIYYTMEYLDGGSLDELISKKHGLSEAEAVKLACQIANALSYMHEHKVLHLDLKPGNIMLNNGNAVLIDFGLSKQYDASGNPESSTTVGGGTPGYAPIEQANYHDGKGFPVTMDIYALGATMYKMLTGQRPPDASEVLNDGLPDRPSSVSSEVWAAVETAMEPMRKKRPQTVTDWVKLLPTAKGTADEDEPTIVDVTPPKPEVISNDNILKFTVKSVSFNMIKVEGGTFMMGAGKLNLFACDHEKPAHRVTLSSYYIGQTQVTQTLWTAVMGNNPSRFKGDNNPVESVDWNDCQNFIKKLNQLTGKRFRLPTEAEWEYACRGGKKSRGYKYSGSNNIDDVAWYKKNSNEETHSVATKSPNELGIYDMSGNVYEWCQDRWSWYSSNDQIKSDNFLSNLLGNKGNNSLINPTGPASGEESRVNRGGCYFSDAHRCRSSARDLELPVSGCLSYFFMGMRLVLSE